MSEAWALDWLSLAPGWMEASPAHLPVPAKPDLAQGTGTGLSGCCPLCWILRESGRPCPCSSPASSACHPSSPGPPPSSPFSPAAPLQRWGQGCTEARGGMVLSGASEGAHAG